MTKRTIWLWRMPSEDKAEKLPPPNPAPVAKAKDCLQLIERTFHPEKQKHWDVTVNDRSITDDYGFDSLEKATDAGQKISDEFKKIGAP